MKRIRSFLVAAALVVVPAVAAAAGFVVFQAIMHPPRLGGSPPDVFTETYFVPDSELGLAPRARYAGVREGPPGFSVYTDGRGARVDQADEPDLDEVDVLTVGGSQSWGQGLASEDTFTSVLAGRLGLTARNLSVPGYGGVQSTLMLRRNLDLRPKIVVYAFWVDHLRRNLRRCALIDSIVCLEAPRIAFDDGGRPFIRYPEDPERTADLLRRWYREAAGGEETTFRTDLYWTAYGLLEGFDQRAQEAELATEAGWARQVRAAEFVLAEMRDAASEAGAELVVVWIPSYSEDRVPPTPPELEEIGQRLGIHLVGMAKRFSAMKEEGEPVGIPGDGHLTARAHREVAEAVADYLAERGERVDFEASR